MIFSTKEMPSASSIFSAYASVATSAMLARSMANDLVPKPAMAFIASAARRLFKTQFCPRIILVIDESTGMSRNELFDSATAYLSSKIGPDTERARVTKSHKDKAMKLHLDKGERVSDSFEGIELQWMFLCTEPKGDNAYYYRGTEKRSFEVSFEKRHLQRVVSGYLPHVIEVARAAGEKGRVLKMYSLVPGGWESVGMEHPATFETVAMEPEAKKAVIDDLERFVKRREFYRRVGRAWKRGYLLYGPPGTGKSSLVAAIANHLRFDVYDLQLSNVAKDSELRKLLLSTSNRSVLVIEDIDCTVELPDRRQNKDLTADAPSKTTVTLSGLLNFVDGLWSSCGDERIIIFTTNHKERLDPALLRPGRMDMHIHMGFCTFEAFKLLASNYLGISPQEARFPEIEALIGEVQVTPAQIAEELMRSDHVETALDGVVSLLKRKGNDADAKVVAKRRKKSCGANKKKVIGLRRRN